MSKYQVSITKVFGAAVTNTIIVEAESKCAAKQKAIDTNWEPYWESDDLTLSDSHEIAKVVVDGETIESTDFNDHLLDEAIRLDEQLSTPIQYKWQHREVLLETLKKELVDAKALLKDAPSMEANDLDTGTNAYYWGTGYIGGITFALKLFSKS